MCSVSAMLDYGQRAVPVQQWTPETWGDFKEIIRRLEALDAKLDQPDCEDPAKAQWMELIEQRLAALEAAD